MGEEVPPVSPEDAASYRVIAARVRELWRAGELDISDPAQGSMDDDQVDVHDIRHVLLYGRIIRHERMGDGWRYTYKGKTVDGDRLSCVVEIDGRLVVVTVWHL